MKNQLETITPQKATEWLKKNTRNRPLSNVRTAKLVAAMLADEWVVNGETIKFNCDGTLIDGQKRLTAVVRSGKTIKSYVVRGLNSDAYDTIDQNQIRSLGDILAVDGKKHYSTLAAAAHWVYALEDESSYSNTNRLTNTFFHEYINSRPDIEKSVTFVRQYSSHFHGPNGLMAALHCLFSKKNREQADLFISRVCTGENLTREMPEYKLREILQNQSRHSMRYPQETICTIAIKCWNASRRGVPIKILKVLTEESRQRII